jgi:hypothetical protein
MDYMILDSAGNALASFEDELDARATLHAIVAVEPEAAEHVVLLAYNDEGMPVGDAMSAFDCPPAVIVEPSVFLARRFTDALVRRVSKDQRRYVDASGPVWEPDVHAAPTPV